MKEKPECCPLWIVVFRILVPIRSRLPCPTFPCRSTGPCWSYNGGLRRDIHHSQLLGNTVHQRFNRLHCVSRWWMTGAFPTALVVTRTTYSLMLIEHGGAIVTLVSESGPLGFKTPFSQGECFYGIAWIALGVFVELRPGSLQLCCLHNLNEATRNLRIAGTFRTALMTAIQASLVFALEHAFTLVACPSDSLQRLAADKLLPRSTSGQG